SLSPFLHLRFLLIILAGIVLITFLTGLYPAFFMSSFHTMTVLKQNSLHGKSGIHSRSILMVVQFIITISLILGTMVIYSQMRFMVKKDPGFDKNHILFFWMNSELADHYDALKEKLLENSVIKEISRAHSVPGNMIMEWGRDTEDGTGVNFFSVPCDENYIPLLGLNFLKGNNFDPDLESDKETYIVNEAFVRKYCTGDPLEFKIGDKPIGGVVQDFMFQSLHYAVKPMAFYYLTDWAWMLAVKVQGNEISEAKNIISQTCSEFTTKHIYVNFLEDRIAYNYIKDERFSTIFTIFSALAIIVSCLGLLGLISFESGRRTKEIGIRKVLGATPLEIVHLFNKKLFLLLGISSVIAWIIGYFWLTRWLQNFAFRIHLNVLFFILSGLLATLIALLTF
ncbi:MAG TPA: hypothetical protein PLD62_11725, partial [Candidatus Cloacimonadota bacterium]|nr:hypothetical protein [Candidatus Cloacimonadota bacterium]